MNYRFSVPSEHVRTIVDPNLEGCRTLYVLVKASELPPELPLDPDPRVPKERGPITHRIMTSLATNDGRFHLLNRGITISAREARYDNVTKILDVDIPDQDERYGILDGGHTHHSIKTISVSENDISDQFVRLEIMVGIEDFLADIAEARNYSQSLKKTTLDAYAKKYDWFLDALGEERKYVRISENDEEPVHVLELIQLMVAINPLQFGRDRHPVEAYSSADKCREYFVAEDDRYGYKKMTGIALDVVRLYDTIRFRWRELYNAKDEDGKGGKYGRTVEAKARVRGRAAQMKYYFIKAEGDEKKGDCPIDKGLAIPLLSAFRSLLHEEAGKLVWIEDPFSFFEKHGTRLTRQVMEASDARNNKPELVGKDRTVYANLYDAVRLAYLEDRVVGR